MADERVILNLEEREVKILAETLYLQLALLPNISIDRIRAVLKYEAQAIGEESIQRQKLNALSLIKRID